MLPTIPSPGLDELEVKAGALLDKFNALPLEKTVDDANGALVAVKDAATNLDKLTGSGSPLDKTLGNSEKLTAELSGNKDICATLHNLRVTSEQLKSIAGELGAQFLTVGQNLNQATDTLKHQLWRQIWPSTKKYPMPSPRKALPPGDR